LGVAVDPGRHARDLILLVRVVVMLFTRDLRVHDNPALALACETADRVVPLFVHDESLEVPPNRARFLHDALADLKASLKKLGGDLLMRHGDPVTETVKAVREFEAVGVSMSADVSAYAKRREERLRRERMLVRTSPGVTIVPPGDVVPSTGGDHYKVFTPYWRAWQSKRWRSQAATPQRILVPSGLRGRALSVKGDGGETAGLQRLERWSKIAAGYAEGHDDLAGDRTSRLSPYLHFGCVSPLMLAAQGFPEAFVRQLCWRDFYHQLLAAFPRLRTDAFRANAADEWDHDDAELEKWRTGNTGVPIVDAGMRQLLTEGWMHNRARLITASYLTKTLGLDWRAGAAWFDRWLVDADVANNYGNWQWVAGTGTDTKPYRRFSPQRQTERFDPDGEYIARYT
jgi:deoxyribodipyrimidine photo-lyase